MIENRFRARYRQDGAGPLILAHRGDSAHAPENTIEAAELGFLAGADGWELDVQLTRDGVPIVLHDESLARTTDVADRFRTDERAARGFLAADFLWDEVRDLDAGSWFLPEGGSLASGRIRVPTLAEALEWTRGRDWLVNVEIKPSPDRRDAVVRSVLALIDGSRMADRVTVSSFDHESVGLLASLRPAVATGLLVDRPLAGPARRLVEGFGADAIHAAVACCDPRVDQGPWPLLGGVAIDRVPVLAYTVNECGPSGTANRLREAGVTGWFTDDPGLFSRHG